MADCLPGEKAALRRALLARRRETAQENAALDGRILEALLASPLWREADTVFCYVSVGWELSTREILRAALDAGKRLAVPRCLPGGVMRAHEVRDLSRLRPGALRIPEPGEDAPVIPPEELRLALVPALAFDRAGYRIGMGGGYYDRCLPTLCCPRVGLCYASFLLPALPREACDVPVDLILTEEGEYTWN